MESGRRDLEEGKVGGGKEERRRVVLVDGVGGSKGVGMKWSGMM